MNDNRNGLFITFEGVEGSGKSTQLRMTADWLTRQGFVVQNTREPGGTPFGREVRRILLDPDGPSRVPLAELLLYLADRYQDIQEIILPALTAGQVVLCDRYHDATIVYQGCARGVDRDTIHRLEEILDIITPDITFLLDIAPEQALERVHRRSCTDTEARAESRFDAEALPFHLKVRQGYLDLAAVEPRFQVLDASVPPEELFTRITRCLTPHLQALSPTGGGPDA